MFIWIRATFPRLPADQIMHAWAGRSSSVALVWLRVVGGPGCAPMERVEVSGPPCVRRTPKSRLEPGLPQCRASCSRGNSSKEAWP